MKTTALDKAVKILLFTFLVFAAIYFAKPVLAPFTIAGLLAMLLYPVCSWLERKKIPRGLSSFLCVLLLLSVLGGILTVLGFQVKSLAVELPKLKAEVTQLVATIESFISSHFDISPQHQEELVTPAPASNGRKTTSILTSVMGFLSSAVVDIVLVLVYIFLLLYFRDQLKKAILAFVPAGNRPNAREIISNAGDVASKYLGGLTMMIGMLWVMYGIGFSIVGIRNAIFFAILCGLLEIVPFVGNLTGSSLTMLMAFSQGGGGSMVLGVLATYLIVQFIQSYLLQPLIVGSEVNINPLFTIIALVVGELVWGIPGMIVAIPVLGIIKVICDHVEPLEPFAILIGEERKNGKKTLAQRIKSWFA